MQTYQQWNKTENFKKAQKIQFTENVAICLKRQYNYRKQTVSVNAPTKSCHCNKRRMFYCRCHWVHYNTNGTFKLTLTQ